jgi:hypothetical protein
VFAERKPKGKGCEANANECLRKETLKHEAFFSISINNEQGELSLFGFKQCPRLRRYPLMSNYEALPSIAHVAVLELNAWRPQLNVLLCVSMAIKLHVREFFLSRTPVSLCLVSCRMEPELRPCLFLYLEPRGEPLEYPEQTAGLLVECPTLRDSTIDPDIFWYELFYGMGMTVSTLSIYARALGVKILASLLEYLVVLTAKLNLDFIGIHISQGLLKLGSFFYTKLNRRVMLLRVNTLLQTVRSVRFTIGSENVTAADVKAELLCED